MFIVFIVVSGSFSQNQLSCSFVFLSISFESLNYFWEKDPEAIILSLFNILISNQRAIWVYSESIQGKQNKRSILIQFQIKVIQHMYKAVLQVVLS